jgi:hypothetical protein
LTSGCGRGSRGSSSASPPTRSPRASEVDGREYHFVSLTLRRDDRGRRVLEWAQVFGTVGPLGPRSSGRPPRAPRPHLRRGPPGRPTDQCFLPPVVTVFNLPPDMTTLRARLRGRASEDEATVERRYAARSTRFAHYGCSLRHRQRRSRLSDRSAVAIFEPRMTAPARRRPRRGLLGGRGFGGARPPASPRRAEALRPRPGCPPRTPVVRAADHAGARHGPVHESSAARDLEGPGCPAWRDRVRPSTGPERRRRARRLGDTTLPSSRARPRHRIPPHPSSPRKLCASSSWVPVR